ncbi:hypothetical protein ACFQNF_19425 [Iodobacter arcticus]|uniref:Immunity protein 30 domain-containing protein n=1 Tax=Iodobacter arcticus TaxID=590593 RepID=A0ABW2R2L7_9NEIS
MDDLKQRLLKFSTFKEKGDDDNFLDALAEAKLHLNYDLTMTLLATFSDCDDYGVQERTRNVLESSAKDTYYPALICSLSKIDEASPNKEWALTLLGIEFEYGNPELLIEYANNSEEKYKEFFFDFISRESFVSEYPSSIKFKKIYP